MKDTSVKHSKPDKEKSSRGRKPKVTEGINRKLLQRSDPGQAEKIASEYASASHDSEHGGAINVLENQKKRLEERLKKSETKYYAVLDKRDSTPPTVPYSGDGKKAVAYAQWSGFDRYAFPIILGLGILLALVGGVNVFVNLKASSPVIAQNSWMGLLIACLLPAGSTALKFMAHSFDNYRARKRCEFTIYLLTTLLLLVWTILFAMNFTGVGSGIDWDNLGESSDKSALLVWCQLVAEMTVAGCLFIAASSTWAKYSTETYRDNIQYIHLCEELDAHGEEYQALCEKLDAVTQQLPQLNGMRGKSLIEQREDFVAAKERLTKTLDL